MTGNISAKSTARGIKRGGVKLSTKLLGPFGVFLQGAIKEPGMVGAVFPSSKSTIDNMMKKVDWENCKLVVEYGPGVGTFTHHLLKHLPADAQLLAIDTNAHYVEHLANTIADPRFKAVLGSATDVERIVKEAGHEFADIVISGLPISTLPEDVAEDMIDATYRVLKPGGAFLTYQYRLKARRLTEQAFDRIDKKYVLMNVPPNHLTWGWKAA
ncbi:methyltransferase domain-containing protein [uncultured Erythrobacter sp.]|uniref:class I SAM-dependent methyltransferase n=1 Tax=uncultured Erythrobacter sp. TaxID=263913 RepID=UPI00260FC1BD|nr:methyltransferase domain-containing protein [uncultured Erythrobacter sp.]